MVAVAAVVGAAALRHRWLNWGATIEERNTALPGDALLTTSNLTTTRAIAIESTAEHIWPWLVQLGQGSGGFYTYDRLENLVRIDIHSAETIVAEWQQLAVGCTVHLAPAVALTVAELDRPVALVLRGAVPLGRSRPPYDFTWAFVLQPRGLRTTRLVIRERYEYHRRWAGLIVQPAELISCLMTRGMLKGIKRRVERMNAIAEGGYAIFPIGRSA